jgi:uncharacterized membrane protein
LKANSDLELVIAELKQPGDAEQAQQAMFDLDDAGRIELIRMAELANDDHDQIDIRIVPGRFKHRHDIEQALKDDFEGMLAWLMGRVFGGNAEQEADLAAGRTATLNLSDEHTQQLVKALESDSTALLVVVEGEVVAEVLEVLRPLTASVQRFRMRVEPSNTLELAPQGKEEPA